MQPLPARSRPTSPGDYGAYATAIAEMLRAPGTDLETAFTHIRSRTHLTTEGQADAVARLGAR